MTDDSTEFLFDAMHSPQIACGKHEVSANPIKVKLKAAAVPRRDQTEDERKAVQCLKEQVTFPPGSWDKRFTRNLLTTSITEKESAQVWRLFHRYRRQIRHPEKNRLLEMAQRLAAPDLRKLAKEAEERQRIAATKTA